MKGFPDLSSKLAAPPKKSLFERQKAEAEAKRARERAETAAVYEDFVKSFDDDGDSSNRGPSNTRSHTIGTGASGPGSLGGLPSKRHFISSSTRLSGPGSLGPAPSLARKRTRDGLYRDRDLERASTQRPFGYDTSRDSTAAFRTSDDEEERTGGDKDAERAVAKPTVYMSSLPPGTSPGVIKSLMPQTLSVDSVRILSPSGQPSTERKSFSAIVTLAKETAGSDIDAAVGVLQKQYLGWGYYLSISRHLSSAAINSGMPVNVGSSSINTLPFGAKTINQGPVGRLNRAPPPGGHRGGFAPPASYGAQYGRPTSIAQIEVKPPSDLKQLRLIHKTLENLLDYGPEFEALLMSRPEVQRDEKWAWLWDPRSTGGVWYRWKLWDVLTNSKSNRNRRGRNEPHSSLLFENGASWVAPERSVRFEYTTEVDEFVSDDDYNSSEDDDSDVEDERRRHAAEEALGNEDGVGYMNPLKKAKLTHLIARLPTANSKLRRGDVARVTAFAIEHAGEGAEEVTETLVANVLNPFAYTNANPDRDGAHSALKDSEVARREDSEAADDPDAANRNSAKERLDTSATKLVGLYVISDILSSSSTSGVRHAWRYRQLFENAFRNAQVFEHLGRLEKDFAWGRLKADKWKRSVGTILHLWEGWCVFPQSGQEHFVQVFENPPLTEEELEKERKKAEAEKASSIAGSKGKGRWKTVDEEGSSVGKFDPSKLSEAHIQRMDIEHAGTPMADSMANYDIDGQPMSDIDGEPMSDSDLDDAELDGQPLGMEEEEGDGQDSVKDAPTSSDKPAEATSSEPQPVRKPRPRAEDMFADSDGEN
jgi:U2-associated protein SR140